jgi:hypothetical protein
MEDDADKLEHWVVLVGKGPLKRTGISCEDDWNGIVLDSDRGYERWRVVVEKDTKLSRIWIRRRRRKKATPVDWINSFVSLNGASPRS